MKLAPPRGLRWDFLRGSAWGGRGSLSPSSISCRSRYAALEQLNSRRGELLAQRDQLQGRVQEAQQVRVVRLPLQISGGTVRPPAAALLLLLPLAALKHDSKPVALPKD